ncbi:sulfatase-like hydrolase/transferase [Sphingobacterium sp. E70]|uniref:sulfatase-like hydrolase/transferase n=1 Tax=Sphingobacterium sp. E70 TaxID=2853439 RepID=UPI0027952A89|nr:sulfatase-like hydrolase/transferase [Sphingobacterium sp. E70]
MNTLKQPFFASFFSLSSHHPFKVPEKYQGKFPKGPLPVQEPIGYTDNALREFFATASKMPWFNNTLFVICADHATVSYLPEYQTTAGASRSRLYFMRRAMAWSARPINWSNRSILCQRY